LELWYPSGGNVPHLVEVDADVIVNQDIGLGKTVTGSAVHAPQSSIAWVKVAGRLGTVLPVTVSQDLPPRFTDVHPVGDY
jgi:hypothetical protein